MGELYPVILPLVLLLFYGYRICILFFGHFNDYSLQSLQISFTKLVIISYVSYVYESNHVNVDAAVDVLS